VRIEVAKRHHNSAIEIEAELGRFTRRLDLSASDVPERSS
jgi:hypothetical protein